MWQTDNQKANKHFWHLKRCIIFIKEQTRLNESNVNTVTEHRFDLQLSRFVNCRVSLKTSSVGEMSCSYTWSALEID